MRNHLDILEEIDQVLALNGLEEERQQLKSEIRASSTGGELCVRSGSNLLTLQNTSNRIDPIIGHLIKELIAYCHHNGLYPIPNYEV